MIPFADVLDRVPVKDALFHLGRGDTDLLHDVTEPASEWRWWAELLHFAPWGVTTQLADQVDDDDAYLLLNVLGYTAELCRRTANGMKTPDLFWHQAAETAREALFEADDDPVNFALRAAAEVAEDAFDHHEVPGQIAAFDALTALAGAAADDNGRRQLLHTALRAWGPHSACTDVHQAARKLGGAA